MKFLIVAVVVALSLVRSQVSARSLQAENGKRLIKTSETDPGHWLNDDQIRELKKAKTHFMDITGHNFPTEHKIVGAERIPSAIQYSDIVNAVIKNIDSDRQHEFLVHFSSYFTRYYSDDTGKESALWLQSQLQNHVDNTAYSGVASVQTFDHSWLQPSIIARIQGADPELQSEVVILGAHLDSYNFIRIQPAPGADDNGSGSVVLLETFRALLEANFVPKRTIEFQWYAAEEVGLRGSGDIAESYSKSGVDVVSMINLDVPGYFEGKTEIGIMTDFVDENLTAFLRTLVESYLEFTWADMECGYACSDHASFYEFNFVTAFPAAIIFDPYMHTKNDVVENVNLPQVVEFTKLAIGYAVELSQPHGA